MNKLIHAEATRMITVLEDSIENSKRLYLIQEIEDHQPRNKPIFPEECQIVNDAIDYMKECSEAYERVAGIEKSIQRVDDVQRTSMQLCEAVRSLYRCIRLDPKAIKVLNEADDDYFGPQTNPFKRYINLLSDLKLQVQAGLATTVEQEQTKHEFVKDLQARTKQSLNDCKALKKALATEVTEKAQELSYLNEISKKLQTELADINASTKKETIQLEKETEEWKVSSETTFESKKVAAIETLTKLQVKAEEKKNENRDFEEQLQKKSTKAQNEVNSILTKYDDDLGERLMELDDIESHYTEEKQRLQELEEYFRKVDRDKEVEAGELRIIAEEQARLDAIQKRLDDAATKIQALYRGVAFRAKAKKGKKKGKRGKKGKKGKKGKGKKK